MYQKIVLVGNLGAEPQMRYTPSGAPVTSFSVATSRKWTDANGEKQEKTTWHRVTAWRKLAETCAQYLKKGSKVLVEGEVEASAFTDRDGNARASLEVTATVVRFLGGKEDGDGDGTANGRRDGFSEDDIPF